MIVTKRRLRPVVPVIFLASCFAVSACGSQSSDPGRGATGGGGGSSSSGSSGGGGTGGQAGAQSGTSGGAGTGGSASTGGSAGGGAGGSAGTGGSAGSDTGGGAGAAGKSGGDAGTSDAPVSSAWIYSKVITIDTTSTGANVTEDVTKYPLAVVLDR